MRRLNPTCYPHPMPCPGGWDAVCAYELQGKPGVGCYPTGTPPDLSAVPAQPQPAMPAAVRQRLRRRARNSDLTAGGAMPGAQCPPACKMEEKPAGSGNYECKCKTHCEHNLSAAGCQCYPRGDDFECYSITWVPPKVVPAAAPVPLAQPQPQPRPVPRPTARPTALSPAPRPSARPPSSAPRPSAPSGATMVARRRVRNGGGLTCPEGYELSCWPDDDFPQVVQCDCYKPGCTPSEEDLCVTAPTVGEEPGGPRPMPPVAQPMPRPQPRPGGRTVAMAPRPVARPMPRPSGAPRPSTPPRAAMAARNPMPLGAAATMLKHQQVMQHQIHNPFTMSARTQPPLAMGRGPGITRRNPCGVGCAPGVALTGDTALDWLMNSACC